MNILRSIISFATLTMMVSPAFAKSLSEHGDWLVFSDTENGSIACVMSTEPTKSSGKYSKRGKIYAVVTHRPSEKRLNEFSFQAGYTLKNGSNVSLIIDGKKSFSLFTNGGYAWATDSKNDKKLSASMRSGNTMVIKGISSRGTKTIDVFSLKGFTSALKAINTACKVK